MRMRKFFAGAAAAATLLGGMALGAGAAIAAPGGGDAPVDLGVNGTLTIAAEDSKASPNPVNGHEFKYVALGYYDGAVADGDVLKSVSIVTNPAVKDDLETFLNDYQTKTDTTTTPKYSDSREYAGNPAAYLAKYYGGTFQNGSADTPKWSGAPRSLLTALAAQNWFKDKLSADPVTGKDGVATITAQQGWYAVQDVTAKDSAALTPTDGNGAYGASLPILAGTTVVPKTGNAFTSLNDQQGVTLGRINVKNELLTVGKSITENNKDQNKVDKNIGDSIDYKLTGKVPNTTGYASYTYSLKDTLSKGLTLNGVSGVAVNVDGKNYTVTLNKQQDDPTKDDPNSGTVSDTTDPENPVTIASVTLGDYTATGENDPYQGGHVLTVTFDGNWILNAGRNTDLVGKAILVTYQATLNQQAIIGDQGNPNKVDLTYSNKPDDPSSSTTVPGENVPPTVITHQFDLTKVAYTHANGFDSKNGLAGAEFQILDENGNAIKFVRNGDDDGDYTRSATQAQTDTDTLTTRADGKLFVRGLDSNTDNKHYTVKETKAPAGYLTTALPTFDVTITATKDGNGDVTGSTVAFGQSTLGLVDTTNHYVGNVTSLTQLPLTGAAGTAMFTVVGLLLAGAAAIAYTRSRGAKRMLA